jgi:HEPN domain-containing protein
MFTHDLLENLNPLILNIIDSGISLFDDGKYNLAVYHAQQAVEKLLKACLSAEGKIGIYKHEIFSFFNNEFNNKINDETMGKLEDAVIPLEESWANSRYPDWSIEPIWIPSQQYTLDNAIQI